MKHAPDCFDSPEEGFQSLSEAVERALTNHDALHQQWNKFSSHASLSSTFFRFISRLYELCEWEKARASRLTHCLPISSFCKEVQTLVSNVNRSTEEQGLFFDKMAKLEADLGTQVLL
jgi:hypothetical protein